MGPREPKPTRAKETPAAKLPPVNGGGALSPPSSSSRLNGNNSNGHGSSHKNGATNGTHAVQTDASPLGRLASAVHHTVPIPELVDVAVDPRVAALALIPHGRFVLTAAYGEWRSGVIVRWVQQVSATPLLVMVAIEKGQPLSPLIRDSRRFALCQIGPEDRVLSKIFEAGREDPSDPFLGLITIKSPGGAPVPVKAAAWLDCELTRHLDVEGNCELYIGLVHAGGTLEHRPTLPRGPDHVPDRVGERPSEKRTRTGAPRRR